MPASKSTFGLTSAQMHHQLEHGHQLGVLLRRLGSFATYLALLVSKPAAA